MPPMVERLIDNFRLRKGTKSLTISGGVVGKGTNLIDELVFEEWDIIEAASIAGSNTHRP